MTGREWGNCRRNVNTLDTRCVWCTCSHTYTMAQWYLQLLFIGTVYALFTSFFLLLSCSPTLGQIDALHGEKEKLQKASAFLVTQLNLKIASENQLMNNYMRSQRDLEKESKRFAVLERAKAKAERELQIFKEYGKVIHSTLPFLTFT